MKILVLNPFAGTTREAEHTVEVAKRCIEQDGAEAILMGCTLQSSPLTIAGKNEVMGVPIIDPVLIGFKTTEFMVEARRLGLPTLSRFGTWQKPPADEVALLRGKKWAAKSPSAP